MSPLSQEVAAGHYKDHVTGGKDSTFTSSENSNPALTQRTLGISTSSPGKKDKNKKVNKRMCWCVNLHNKILYFSQKKKIKFSLDVLNFHCRIRILCYASILFFFLLCSSYFVHTQRYNQVHLSVTVKIWKYVTYANEWQGLMRSLLGWNRRMQTVVTNPEQRYGAQLTNWPTFSQLWRTLRTINNYKFYFMHSVRFALSQLLSLGL